MRHSRHTRTKLGTFVLGSEKSFADLKEDYEICMESYPQVMASLEWPENMEGKVLKVTLYGIDHMQETTIEDEVPDLLNDAKGG